MKTLIKIICFFNKRLNKNMLNSNQDYFSDSEFYFDIESPFVAVR
jgi:hypothetical protein